MIENKESDVKKTDLENELATSADIPEPQEQDAFEHRLGLSMLAKTALGVFVIVALVIGVSNVMKHNELREQAAALEAQKEEKEKEIGALRYLYDAPMDDEYIARIAQERLGLEFSDEKQYHNNLND